MTIPDDLELDRALLRAVATIPVDVDAGWRDLERRARRTPARVAFWIAAAAVVLVAVLIPIRLLAGAESSLDVTGDPGTEQPAPTDTDLAPPTEPPAGSPRPIRLLLELPACADAGDLDAWASSAVTTLDDASVSDPFVATTVADVLAVTPMPTDAGASCAVARRAGDVVAYEIRDESGARLGRGVSVPYASDLVPLSFRHAPSFQNAIGSGQSVSGTMTRSDGIDLLTTTYSGTAIDGRLIAVELAAPATDPDLQHAGLVHLSSLTGDRLDPMLSTSAIAGSALPTRLPSGYQLCVPFAVTELDAVAGLGPGGVVYCDDQGDEIRFVTGLDDEWPSIGMFSGLPLDVTDLEPSAGDRRTLGLGTGPTYFLIVDVPATLAGEELLDMLQSVPGLDPRVIRPTGGSNDYRDELVSPRIDGALASAGMEATADRRDPPTPGFASFELRGVAGEVLGLRVYASPLPGVDPAPLLPVNAAAVLDVRTVGGIDVVIASSSAGPEGATPQVAFFRCGSLDWQVSPTTTGTTTLPSAGATPTTAAPPPPDFEQNVIDLVEVLARGLPC